ncbi:DISARM system helicase DrmA [Deinococcus peraridilitoris]|uniref:Helicase family protein with metal-binding cysteine cluster n=1 Tax=Deinococcus peraridilitoris (strain DSM 19664 / LMG 22246 / CIP 109416 / KR-200) TaxID=937777 RepID=L0A1Y5_DEIPD|nr:DISARM system helicase DrmA [Deinococcus peraridilitoris]AFZ67167.1 helicase family protein with metal-binding cysteine cluster [Deinococcus peraridilitoris DSM 19664]
MTNEVRRRRGAPEERPPRIPNAWLIGRNDWTRLDVHTLVLPGDKERWRDLEEGDAVLVAEEHGGEWRAVHVGGIFRVRSTASETTYYFDVTRAIDGEPSLESLSLGGHDPRLLASRLGWTAFEAAIRASLGMGYAELPTSRDQAYLRELLRLAVVDDLLGPADGPHEEIVEMSVRDRYLVGKLAPVDTTANPILSNEDDQDEEPEDLRPREGVAADPGQELGGASGRTSPEDDVAELDASRNASIVPSSFGMTFCLDAGTTHVEVEATWGRYERRESERHVNERTEKPLRAWKRRPSGGKFALHLAGDVVEPVAPDPACPSVVVRGRVRLHPNGRDRLVTLFLVNTQRTPDANVDAAWLFQPELVVRDLGRVGSFRRRPPLEPDGSDPEREALAMLYREQVEFAVGHGVAVAARVAPGDPERATEVRTGVMPSYEVPITETPPQDDLPSDFLDMRRLAAMDRNALTSGLDAFVASYSSWIEAQRAKVGHGVDGWDDTAKEALKRCEHVRDRLQVGVDVLRGDDEALAAFRFANLAMADQRVRSIYSLRRRRGETLSPSDVDTPGNHSWRAFQLAFVLLGIPSLADPAHKDRTDPVEGEADLLWFPTGGGKTEAYLGVAAFAMAMRRLRPDLGGLDASRGLAVVMRYTLRLLTMQQFQRASALLCAMEQLRTAAPDVWGRSPFRIGLWVGQKSTPNTVAEAHEAIKAEKEGKRPRSASPAQLTTCPWCGSTIEPKRDVVVDRERGLTHLYCPNVADACPFSDTRGDGLPVVVVDEELYHRPPTMLIATVDKFALMAWKGEVRTLFGRVERECPRHGLLWPDSDCTGNHPAKGSLPKTTVRNVRAIRPPDLIIQDEFHLISGPLGTMVGLYETAVDALCSWKLDDGTTVRPKVIASTATVRKAAEQVNGVFLRCVAVFPPHGLDVGDNFFSKQTPTDEKPGRLYLGVCAPGSSKPAMLIRVYVALLTGAQALFERFGDAADPYMTLVGYFNALRELGGMKRLSEDDVQTRSFRVQMSQIARPGLAQRSVREVVELTSRVSNRDIPLTLDRLETKHKRAWSKGEARAVDVVLATNMLSVGVDVNRLGVMAVNGQPKTTAEYIQATSRVGRSFPGLVVTVLSWSRPRDLSHYESFEHYHATFYQHVEAQSVTPFAPRALDRGLTGTLVSLVRLDDAGLNPNEGAAVLGGGPSPEPAAATSIVERRAGLVTGRSAAGDDARDMARARFDRWIREASRPGRVLGYQEGGGTVAPLLQAPGASPWAEFTVPMSMREVEPGVRLVMDKSAMSDGPAWRAAPAEHEGVES